MKCACTSQKQVIRLKRGYTSNICELWNRRGQAFWPWATRQWILKTLPFLGRDCFGSSVLVFSLPTVCFTARFVSHQGLYQHSKHTQVLLSILRSRNRTGISDLSLNVSGILRWACLQQSPVKSQVCSLFFQIAVVSLAVPSTALSHSLGCNKECCRYRLKAPWSAVKFPVIIVTPQEPLKTHSAHCPNSELLGKVCSFLIFLSYWHTVNLKVPAISSPMACPFCNSSKVWSWQSYLNKPGESLAEAAQAHLACFSAG